MIKKIIIGVLAAALVGMFVNSFFVGPETSYRSLLFSKIAVTSIFTGFLCGIYSSLSQSKLQVFLISVVIGIIVFYTKYFVTGHDLDPLTMGAFVGAMIGGVLAIDKKIRRTLKLYKRLKKLREKGFTDYSESRY